ncbi:MAG TPA: M28 family peptidase [Candidatus Aminicenantes bacterium]|nr:M28 family peptidase [Candidatus Aminicenantes bacterium]HRY65089.1 M28 family peptidase [Candidatus Aminicenantes bacterium]HRZ72002.1 M28 family peptidase [Candidatus Aminicenantes bacterium]
MKIRPTRFAALLALAALLVPSPAAAQTLDRNLRDGLAAISPAEVYDIVKTLAGQEFAGRLTGHPGYTAAARWAAGKLAAWGLKPISGKDGYLQPYPSPYTVIDQAEMTVLLPSGTAAYREMPLVPGKDFLPLLYSDSGDRTADAVFAGWGISAPEAGYDDYAGLDVKGKFVLCFRGTPDARDPRYQRHDEHRTRMKTALDKGALGLVYAYPDDDIGSNPNGDFLAGFTPAVIGMKVLDAILADTSSTAADLKKALIAYKRPISFPVRARIRLAVRSRHFPQAVGYNVVGYIEGSDPRLRRECVVIGGHFDHTGAHLGILFPGADDNASGSATSMAAGKALAALARKPRRSIVIALFGGEEMGLQGSTWFADHVPGPFDRVAGMLNFDMTGEGDKLWGAAGAEPPEFRKALEEADATVKVLRGLGVIDGVGVRGSDFAPFFLKGIPAASLGSAGPHLAYHQAGDTIYRINPDIMADAAKLAFLAAYAWADR